MQRSRDGRIEDRDRVEAVRSHTCASCSVQRPKTGDNDEHGKDLSAAYMHMRRFL